MRIYLNISAEFYSDPIWNVGAVGFFEEEQEEQDE